jgi:hypothetical protein
MIDHAFAFFERNQAPRSKLRGMTALSQAAGFQPAYAASGGECDPKRFKLVGSDSIHGDSNLNTVDSKAQHIQEFGKTR